MCPKDRAERKKRVTCTELKKEMSEKHDYGVRAVDLAKLCGRSTSTTCVLLKLNESIKSRTPAKDVRIFSNQPASMHENTGKALMVWLMEKKLAADTVTEDIIGYKGRVLFRGPKRMNAISIHFNVEN